MKSCLEWARDELTPENIVHALATLIRRTDQKLQRQGQKKCQNHLTKGKNCGNFFLLVLSILVVYWWVRLAVLLLVCTNTPPTPPSSEGLYLIMPETFFVNEPGPIRSALFLRMTMMCLKLNGHFIRLFTSGFSHSYTFKLQNTLSLYSLLSWHSIHSFICLLFCGCLSWDFRFTKKKSAIYSP